MIKKLGKYQSQDFYSWSGLTKENHLGEAGLIQPQKVANLMVQLMAYDRGGMNLEALLSQYPTREFESHDDYYWDVIGAVRRNIPLVEARREDGTPVEAGSDNVGVNTAPFYLVFDEDYFGDGEIIVGNLNQVYPMRILGPAQYEGSRAVYKVELN